MGDRCKVAGWRGVGRPVTLRPRAKRVTTPSPGAKRVITHSPSPPSLIRGRRSQRDAMLPARLVALELERGLERLTLTVPGMMENLIDGGRLFLGRHRHELAGDTQV